MSDEKRIERKVAHVDDLKYAKVYLDKRRDIHEENVINHINDSNNQIQSDLSNFKTQIESDNDEFKTQIEADNGKFKPQVKNRLNEIIASVNAKPTIINLNLTLISAGTSYSSNTNETSFIFNKNNFGYSRSSYVLPNEYTDAILEQIQAHKQCTVVINDTDIYTGCEVEYYNNYAYIRIYNAGISISIFGTKAGGNSAGTIGASNYDVANPGNSKPLTITRLEFRGA